MTSGIYKIKSKVDWKVYVGRSVDIPVRWSGHKSQLRKGEHGNPHLQRAWNKYGEDNFIFEVLEECEPDLLQERESYYIDKFDCMNPCNGYNMMPSAPGMVMSEELREKMRQAKLGTTLTEEHKLKIKHGNTGKKRTPETLERMRQANLGKTLSDEHKKKVSESVKTTMADPELRKRLSEAHKGKKFSEETRKKLSEAKKGKKRAPHSEESKKRMAESARNRKPISEETRQKMREAAKNRKKKTEEQ